LMIDNWNANIKPHDSVWHLGDVFSGDKDSFCDIWARLNGRKRLIVGNHDDIRYLSGKNPRTGSYFFQKIDVWRVFREHNIILTHIPMELSNSYEGRTADFNVHGHIHSNPSPTVRHYNACVEPNGFAPIHLEELSSRLNKRKSSI
jgi:calcineurin-like phosphoesterase family protein